MTSKPAFIAVYGPPKSDLPHIAVVIYPDGEVTGLAAISASAAETLVNELARTWVTTTASGFPASAANSAVIA